MMDVFIRGNLSVSIRGNLYTLRKFRYKPDFSGTGAAHPPCQCEAEC
jgi:hypothetical protein